MKSLVHLKNKARRLRTLGYSYNEIINIIPVSKSSLSIWLRNLPLTKEQYSFLEKQLENKQISARMRAALTNREKRRIRDEQTLARATSTFARYKNEPLFIAGVLLYWAEGTKKDTVFSFINSDPSMVKMMLKWIKKYLGKTENDMRIRLFIHKIYSHENCENYWSKIINIPKDKFKKTIYKANVHLEKKNPNYKGCLRICVGGVEELRKTLYWQKLAEEYILSRS
ncbi:MAG: hypothetical protein UT05_C0010G0030 [Parcubacteria group bacterium GW2011_GWF2_38_76]|nr:MAG: hypothetical protein UT05_C0010G0030 [Parcubacteria group bacterium GW2011_GWF2_38_76]HBM45538.1 hypothetical protein [Patescibacteria group bacterium]